MRIKFTNEKGQSLVEVVVALAVVVLAITALVRVTVTSIRNANFAKNRALATKYAQEWIEEARQLRDEQGDDFFTDTFAANTCSASDTLGVFNRTRTCNLNGGTMTVVVTVSWTSGSISHESRLETYLTNWK